MEPKLRIFLLDYLKALANKNAAIFAGAGLSAGCGYVNWKDLLRTVAEDLGLDVDHETDLIAVAQCHLNDKMGRGALNQLIIDELTKQAILTENHKILANLPIETYWTTNYDQLIEEALKLVGKRPDVKIVQENLAINKPKRNAVVYKMHGDVQLPDKAVLTKEDYETYELNRKLYSITLQSDLLSKTFLFIGFSFEDPNLIYILSRVKNLIGVNNTRQHYCLFKRETDPIAKKRQELKIKDLNRFGINGMLIDDYTDITGILKKISGMYKRSQIFISGSIDDYKSVEKEKVFEFTNMLGRQLIKNQYKIVSGFGKGIGSNIINGALNQIFTTNYRNLDEYLILRPFPKGEKDPQEKRKLNKEYRQAMIKEAGIAIFIYGNKIDDSGKTIVSSGVQEEFDLAVEAGLKVIPVGATGFKAKIIWENLMNNFDFYYPDNGNLKDLFLKIGDQSLETETIVNGVIEIVNKLNKVN
jgi:hypothetical protein